MFAWLSGENLNKAIDTLSKIAQVAAFMVAGWWAYKTFFESVKPGLEFRGNVQADLDWNKPSDPYDCPASLDISIANEGVSSFNVSNILVRGWLYTSDKKTKGPTEFLIDRPTADHPVYIDYDKVEESRPFYSVMYSGVPHNSGLLGHYAPGAKHYESWDWYFMRTKRQGVIFRVDIRTSDNVTQFVHSAWVSDETCVSPDATSTTKPH